MSADSRMNGHVPEETKSDLPTKGTATEAQPAAPKRPRPKKKPNYAQIHSKPLPLEAHPLAAFHPSNPLSLLRLCYIYLSHLISPPSSHSSERYIGYFSSETRSVHVTDPKHVRALWEMGFFGKGALSRSEPSWLDREKARLKAERGGRGGGTAEEATNARREERRLFKLERARLEREKIERQRLVEEGKLDPQVLEITADAVEAKTETEEEGTTEADKMLQTAIAHLEDANPLVVDLQSSEQSNDRPRTPHVVVVDPVGTRLEHLPSRELPVPEEPEPDIENQEHLQLTLEEAFYLSYALGVLDVRISDGKHSGEGHASADAQDLITTFERHSYFPPKLPLPAPVSGDHDLRQAALAPDSRFLLSYVVYHHFRSLGWVVRPGVKFSVDYLLYNRGPVFSHAEFAVLIMPSFTHPYWSTDAGHKQKRVKEPKDWWWLHCINRVQSQVRKTLVMCYVDVPPPIEMPEDGKVDIGALLKGYTVREFVVRRWLANRSRD